MESEIASEKFFTLRKLWWCTVYNLMLIGAIASWVFIRVQVLGDDVVMEMPEQFERSRR